MHYVEIDGCPVSGKLHKVFIDGCELNCVKDFNTNEGWCECYALDEEMDGDYPDVEGSFMLRKFHGEVKAYIVGDKAGCN